MLWVAIIGAVANVAALLVLRGGAKRLDQPARCVSRGAGRPVRVDRRHRRGRRHPAHRLRTGGCDRLARNRRAHRAQGALSAARRAAGAQPGRAEGNGCRPHPRTRAQQAGGRVDPRRARLVDHAGVQRVLGARRGGTARVQRGSHRPPAGRTVRVPCPNTSTSPTRRSSSSRPSTPITRRNSTAETQPCWHNGAGPRRGGPAPVADLPVCSVDYFCSTTCRSRLMVTSSPRVKPPASSAAFQLTPKSWRLILVDAVAPALTRP